MGVCLHEYIHMQIFCILQKWHWYIACGLTADNLNNQQMCAIEPALPLSFHSKNKLQEVSKAYGLVRITAWAYFKLH